MAIEFGELFSRERLAGYEPSLLEGSTVLLVGAGAASNNIAMNLALAGIGELWVVDYDVVEVSNLTRSPLFAKAVPSARSRHKSREVARGFLGFSYAQKPTARFAISRIEDLGLGALCGAGVVISAADAWSVRAWLSDATRLLGISLIEIGFFGNEGGVSVFPNQKADQPCWRCLHPRTTNGGVGCSLYARKVVEQGKTPATQPLAATFGALAAEAALQALHNRFPLAGKSFQLDIHTGSTSLIEVTPDPDCPGVHRTWPAPVRLESRSTATAIEVLSELRQTVKEPILHLPSPFVARAPCCRCGRPVAVNSPSSRIHTPPACEQCEPLPSTTQAPIEVVTTVAIGDHLARRSLRRLGFHVGDIFEVEDGATGESIVARLAGSADDIFVTMRGKARNAGVSEDMSITEADSLGRDE